MLRADDGFTGKFTWAENTSPQSKNGAQSAKQANSDIPAPPGAAKIAGESTKKALSTRTAAEQAIKGAPGAPGSTEQPFKSASAPHITTARTAKNTPGTPVPAEPAGPEEPNLAVRPYRKLIKLQIFKKLIAGRKLMPPAARTSPGALKAAQALPAAPQNTKAALAMESKT